jgi:hypothetical protein
MDLTSGKCTGGCAVQVPVPPRPAKTGTMLPLSREGVYNAIWLNVQGANGIVGCATSLSPQLIPLAGISDGDGRTLRGPPAEMFIDL